ncbi:Fmp46 [Kluyveromyces lactis]|nr:Fmp46 [Kluyveromyces lactis]
MSMFKTIQFQPRVVTLFTHKLESSHAQNLLTALKSNHKNKINIEICQKFPTRDQLEYLAKIDKPDLLEQIPKTESLLKKAAEDPLFGSPLQKCVENGSWNKQTSLWVDWEKAVLGTTVQSLKEKWLPKN